MVDIVEATAVSPDQRNLAVARWTGNERHVRGCAEIWDLTTGARPQQTGEQPLPLAGVVYSPDSHWILTWDTRPQSTLLWDAARLKSPPRPLIRSLDSPITRAVFSADGKALLLACRDGTARLWDVALTGSYSPNAAPTMATR